MSEDPGSGVKKPMDPSSILEAIFIFIGNLLFKAIDYLSAFTHSFHKFLTPSKSLSDMPVDVVSLIVERLNYKEQLKLRKVSKSLRAFVDKQKPACKSIRVVFWDKIVIIKFDGLRVTYQSYHEYNDDGSIVIRDGFEKAALDDLASTLKNPKLQLEELCFDANKDMINNYNKIKCVLESLSHQVSVKEIDLRMSSLSSLLSILPYLKPGLLEKIILRNEIRHIDWSTYSIGMDKVACLEQWKQAKELELWDPFDEFLMKYATHFKRFHIHLRSDGEQFARMKEFLSKLKIFEKCTLVCHTFYSDPNLIEQLLGEPVSSTRTEEVFHHPIADSDYYFELKRTANIDVKIEKKKRESNR